MDVVPFAASLFNEILFLRGYASVIMYFTCFLQA